SLADAVAAPRIHHQALPDQTYYEHGGLSDATVQALQAMGHKMDERRGRSGIIAAIQKTAGGRVRVADPRYPGGAVGFRDVVLDSVVVARLLGPPRALI